MPNTPSLKQLRQKIETLVEAAVTEGWYLRRMAGTDGVRSRYGAINHTWFADRSGGCCLLGAVILGAGQELSRLGVISGRAVAAAVLGIDEDAARDLEQGFEADGTPAWAPVSADLHTMGAAVARKWL